MKRFLFVLTVLSLLFNACKSSKPIGVEVKEDGLITFKFIQLNDVYEIAPLNGGKYGGMARVAHVRDSITSENPNTYMFMAGDFLNPSLLGTVKLNGERIRGKQMIEVMNAMNFTLATFGNHEFDIGEDDLQKRLNESNFQWMSANVFQVTPDGPRSFVVEKPQDTVYVPQTDIIKIKDADGTEIEVGFMGVTIPSNPQDFVYYSDIYLEAGSSYSALNSRNVDVIIGLTHLTIAQDQELAKRFPNISLIMGGHEHNSMLVPEKNSIIAKADANAKTIYIHTLTYNTKSKNLKIDSHLMPIDERVASKPEVQLIVNRWNDVLEEKIREVISDPYEVIYTATTPLDGTDSASRGIQTNLGNIITHAMYDSFDDVDGALVNGGSIRLDDVLDGEVTSIDIFRVLPFGGGILKVEITGSLLKEVLDFGKASGGTGAYLQRYKFEESSSGGWLLNGSPLVEDKVYKIAFSDFLLRGFDIPFLTPDHKDVLSVYTPADSEAASDIRKAIILYMKSLKE